MTPEQFINRWRDNPLTERAGAQAHFDDLCELLGVDKPRDRDNYCFERGAKKMGGGDGWADVWKRDHFAWKNKSPKRDLVKAATRIATLFAAMQQGGAYGSDDITWFNGGLFAHIDIPPLLPADLACLHRVAAEKDWRAIDPTIFGTLFESGLDPNSRAELGAHFTDVATIQKIIDPLITRPLAVEWQTAKATITAALVKSTPRSHKAATNAYHAYLEHLRNFRVLDAACGSGNFLYLALHALKALEHAAQLDAEALGLQQQLGIECGTINILGLEINEYAAELARVTVWIGDLQWCQRNGRPIHKRPALHSLDAIEHRDALLNADGTEAIWPKADVLVGNPPFLGGSKKRGELGDAYFDALNAVYAQRVPGFADLVCYWFEKARTAIAAGTLVSAGLVATNSIRGGANRKVLDTICKSTRIFEAWSDEPWVNEGAAVRVSTPPLASCTAACTNSGRCACALGWALAMIRATHPPPALKPSRSPKVSRLLIPRTSRPKRWKTGQLSL